MELILARIDANGSTGRTFNIFNQTVLPSASQKRLRFSSIEMWPVLEGERKNTLNPKGDRIRPLNPLWSISLPPTSFKKERKQSRTQWIYAERGMGGRGSGYMCTYHATDHFVPRIHLVDFDDMITEIQRFKTILLSQQSNKGASGPVESFAKALPAVQRKGQHELSLARQFISYQSVVRVVMWPYEQMDWSYQQL